MKIETLSLFNKPKIAQPSEKNPQGGAAQDRRVGDIITISDEARQKIEAEKAAEAERTTEANRATQIDELKQQLDSANAQADAFAKSSEAQAKCLQIAMSIISGDRVPDKDRRFLMENNNELYSQAIMLRKNKENPKDLKSITEEKQESSAATTVDADIAQDAIPAPEASAQPGSASSEPPE